MVELEDPTIVVAEDNVMFSACVVKSSDTVRPVVLEITDVPGTASPGLGTHTHNYNIMMLQPV